MAPPGGASAQEAARDAERPRDRSGSEGRPGGASAQPQTPASDPEAAASGTRRQARAPGGEPVYVAVVGEGQAGPEALARAEAVGRLLAARGAVVVCGGMGGVMDAAARGAAAAGGVSIGILPGERREEGSPALTYRLPTGLGHARNALVVLAADAVIAVGGRAGTLTEIGFALVYGKPVVGLGTWLLERAEVGPGPLVEAVDTPEAAVERALARARRP